MSACFRCSSGSRVRNPSLTQIFFFFNDTATTEIYTLSLHDALPIFDLMRPVPVAPLSIETSVVREGRKAQLCSVRLLADNVEVVRASALRIRLDHAQLPDRVIETPLDVDEPETARAPQGHSELGSPFIGGISMRVPRGA